MAAAILTPSLALAQEIQLEPGAAVLHIDNPSANVTVINGFMVELGGWTTGSRVDIYLDGPAGMGEGIGSGMVGSPRPDVARAARDSMFEATGFNISWE